MSSFATLKDAPATEKVVLIELDFGEILFLTNYSAGVWYINIDRDYPDIDDALLVGVPNRSDIVRIGSVDWDNQALAEVASVAAVQSTEASFYWDSAARECYIHGVGGNSPVSHQVVIGITASYANVGRVFGSQTYEPRVRAVPAISRARDPLFFGRLEFRGGAIQMENRDGHFDLLGDDEFTVGSIARVLVGFDDLALADFRQVYEGRLRELGIGAETVGGELVDKRLELRRQVPTTTYDTTTYPDLDPGLEGAAIPLVYGVCRNVPVTVTNQKAGGSPTWTCKIAQALHAIDAITAVRVEGMAVTPASTDLANAEFTLNNGDYTDGDEVTADVTGYEDGAGDPIENALDVIKDLITEHLPITYTSTFFDTAAWDAATALVADIGLFISEPTDLIAVIEDISESVFGLFAVTDDGLFTYKVFVNPGSSTRTIRREDLLEVGEIRYSVADALTSVQVGYSRDWAAGSHKVLTDQTQESVLLTELRVRRQERFDTLLVDAVAAQAHADTILELQGRVEATVPVSAKMSVIDVDIDDWVNVQLDRPVSAMLGFAFCQVLAFVRDLEAFEVELELRVWARIAEPVTAVTTAAARVYSDTETTGTHYSDGVHYSDPG